ncbi:MAG: hypothetical protein ICV83_09945 [Cytophagales bacterium]|nr:hypothetical protein [Cytophagales bacterium]
MLINRCRKAFARLPFFWKILVGLTFPFLILHEYAHIFALQKLFNKPYDLNRIQLVSRGWLIGVALPMEDYIKAENAKELPEIGVKLVIASLAPLVLCVLLSTLYLVTHPILAAYYKQTLIGLQPPASGMLKAGYYTGKYLCMLWIACLFPSRADWRTAYTASKLIVQPEKEFAEWVDE